MRYTLEHEDTIATLILHEDKLDSEVGAEFKAEIMLHAQSGIEALLVDMSEVMHCDSAGMSAMLFAHRAMKSAGGATIFVGLAPTVEAIINVAQLDNVLYLYPTREEALADLAGDGGDEELE